MSQSFVELLFVLALLLLLSAAALGDYVVYFLVRQEDARLGRSAAVMAPSIPVTSGMLAW